MLAVFAAGFLFARSQAHACSAARPTVPTALPRSGGASVSIATSLIVVSSLDLPSLSLSLNAAGQSLSLGVPVALGGGVDGTNAGTFWRLPLTNQMLLPSAEHVLTATVAGAPVELTRFTTAASYDKQPGTPPILKALHLWRVRYPVADIASGNCVFAEYHGFLTVDYTPATIPNTPVSSVVHTFELAPKTGGRGQTFVYAGDTAFAGNEPADAYPLPIGDWQPELDPTRTYCLTIGAFGDGDLARPRLTSETLCADVTQLSAPGAPPSPTVDVNGVGSHAGSGGCSIAAAPTAFGAPFVVFALLGSWRRRRR